MIEDTKTIRISLGTWMKLNNRRGLNGCSKFEDVVEYLIKIAEEKEKNE